MGWNRNGLEVGTTTRKYENYICFQITIVLTPCYIQFFDLFGREEAFKFYTTCLGLSFTYFCTCKIAASSFAAADKVTGRKPNTGRVLRLSTNNPDRCQYCHLALRKVWRLVLVSQSRLTPSECDNFRNSISGVGLKSILESFNNILKICNFQVQPHFY